MAGSIAIVASVAVIAMTALGVAHAGNIEVAPTTIEFVPGKDRTVFYATNRGSDPVALQVDAFDWMQGERTDDLSQSHRLAVSPPMARLLPGDRQIIRLALKKAGENGSAAEESYRLIVSEIPDGALPEAAGMRVMLKFSIPVFRVPVGGKFASLDWTARYSDHVVILSAHNGGVRHAKLINLTAQSESGGEIPIGTSPNYVLAGATRTWSVPAPTAATIAALHVVGRDESGGGSIDATVNVQR